MSDIKRQKLASENGKLTSNNFLYHPKSVLSGVVSEGLTNVSIKSATAVNFVVANELVFKQFGLLKELHRQENKDLIDYIIGDETINGHSFEDLTAEYKQEISTLQNDLNDSGLEKIGAVSESNGKLNLLEAIKNLSNEFSGKNTTKNPKQTKAKVLSTDSVDNSTATSDAEDEEVILINELKTANNQLRSLFEKENDIAVVFENQAGKIGNGTSNLKNHLRVVRVGPLKLIEPDVNPAAA